MVVYYSRDGDTIFYEVQSNVNIPRNGDVKTITVDTSFTGMYTEDWVQDQIEKEYGIETYTGQFEKWVDPPDCGFHPMTDRLLV